MKRYIKVITDNDDTAHILYPGEGIDDPAYIMYRGYEIRYNFIHRPDCYYIIHNGKQVYFESIEEAQDFIDDLYSMR